MCLCAANEDWRRGSSLPLQLQFLVVAGEGGEERSEGLEFRVEER